MVNSESYLVNSESYSMTFNPDAYISNPNLDGSLNIIPTLYLLYNSFNSFSLRCPKFIIFSLFYRNLKDKYSI